MAIKYLWKQCIPSVKEKPKVSFELARNETVAIDINFWFHALMSKPQNALSM